jgi:sortase A
VKKSAANQTLHSLLFGLGTGSIVILIFMFSFFNERIIAPFIQPSRTVSNIPIIAGSGDVGPDPEVIIPKINVEIPVVYDTAATNDTVIQKDLEQGVVHYAGTANPGQDGNLVIVGHSSNNIFNPGKYKFAFVLLHQLQPGDTFYLLKDGKRYTYQVYQRQIVSPNDVSVLGATDKAATATLITCDPPGTSNNRLVVTGEQIDPSPTVNIAAANQSAVTANATIIPGNSPSLWSRLTRWFTQ